LAHINVRSLLPKIEEIRYLLHSGKIDVLCITETWLDETIFGHEVDCQGYTLFRNDRNRHGGGVAIYVKDGHDVILRQDLTDNEIESVWVEMKKIEIIDSLLVCAIYRPPSSSHVYYENMINVITKAASNNKEMIILGDFNYDYKLDESLSNNPVKYIEDLFSLRQLILDKTRVTPNSAKTLDLILSSIPNIHSNSGVHKIGLSDHFLCYTCLDIKKPKYMHKVIRSRNYKRFDEKLFMKELKDNKELLDVKFINDTHSAWAKWKSIFNYVCNLHAPLKESRVKERHNPWITPQVVNMMYKRDYLHSQANKTKNPNLWNDYKELRNSITKKIKLLKKEYYSSLTDIHQNNPKKFWKEIKKIMPNKINTSSLPNDMTVEELNTYFGSIGRDTVKLISGITDNKQLFWKGPKSIYNFSMVFTDSATVAKYLKVLGNNSNIDIHGMDSKLLSISAPVISSQICHIINLSIAQGNIPDDWKVARVTPIYKGKGNKDEPGNYRPISVICHIAKIMEKIIHAQLIKYLTIHDFISIDQSAYLKNHSTQTSLHRVIDDWLENINEGLLTGACFLDIQKCFDTIDHDLLLAKLECYGIKDNELNWFHSYLSRRSQRVLSNGSLSKACDLQIGVPQGSILGPLLFLLYVNDIGNFVIDGYCNCFADDTIIYVSGKTVEEVTAKLQTCLEGVEEWYKGNRLKVNASKSNIMLVGSSQKLNSADKSIFKIMYESENLQMITNVKYLGVKVDECLSWKPQISNICKNVAPKLALMRRLQSQVPRSTLEQIYKSYIQPILEYCCTIWGFSGVENVNKIQHLQNWAARIVLNNYDFINTRGIDLVRNLGWQDFTQRRDYLMASLMYKVINGNTSRHLFNNLLFASDVNERVTRNTEMNNIYLPKANIDIFKESLQYMGGVIWNSLNSTLKSCKNVNTFKRNYTNIYWAT
jgi:hypothetical protein